MTERVELVLAPNPGPMTFDGTNSWVLVEPGGGEAVVVDPGPDDPGHLGRLVAVAARRGAVISRILLTHRHGDHAEGARALADRTGAPVLASDGRCADGVLRGGDVLDAGGLRVEVLATPGHSRDSLSFALPADSAVLTGDTVLGRGAPAILHPDGRVADMIASLRALRSRHAGLVLPGHGPVVSEPGRVLDAALRARARRLESVVHARRGGSADVAEIVDALYPALHPHVRRAAEATVRAHLAYLDTDPDLTALEAIR
ncbi:MBL fold metallo-hydrolase [Pseudonocardia nigra]|uniref:MBL fold metallo-hydrolase n=1 Tax=Pseudonocardia nigra TaxID=1921578 RepID=UPI001C600269|nr:MBL fold metallo-hydrolase [Pseudonocardia nigra]